MANPTPTPNPLPSGSYGSFDRTAKPIPGLGLVLTCFAIGLGAIAALVAVNRR